MTAKTPNRRLIENYEKLIQQFMAGKSYRPLQAKELIARLGIPEQHCGIFMKVLKNLVDDRSLSKRDGLYSLEKADEKMVRGILRVHPRGFGFLQADDTSWQDVFIPKHLTMHAIDGDRVEVIVNPPPYSEKGPEGKVITILERSRTHLAGIIKSLDFDELPLAYVPLLGTEKKVLVKTLHGEKLDPGDRIVMQVESWGTENSPTIAHLSHFIGALDDPSCDIEAALEEYELRKTFPYDVIHEAKKFGNRVLPREIGDREDFRDCECVTIDPDTAKDFDDAITVEKLKKGGYRLYVHIADVSHYVKPGSALDEEAGERCNSTYFPAFCLPMLPEELSNNLCSLKPNVNRLAVSVIMDFDATGERVSYRIVKSVIRSSHRFTYREAKEVLDGKKSPFSDHLARMVELCKLLKRKRYERGSIEFALSELVILVDDRGMPRGTDLVRYDITHQMVEEFMLKANETVAWHLSNIKKGLTYRVHEEPAAENMRDFIQLAQSFGFKIPEKATAADIQELFDEAINSPYGGYLAVSFIRRMKMASYSPENIGHYGLALSHYCHFTSPIRRYVDLVVHRVLFGHEESAEGLEKIALNCSEQERISARAESSVKMLKKLRLLETMAQEEKYRHYPAVVTGIKPFGFFFEILDLMLEGFIHISEIGDDYFVYDEARMKLEGRRTGTAYHPGNKIDVVLKDIDLIMQETKWQLVSPQGSAKRKAPSRRNPEKKARKTVGRSKDRSRKKKKR